jgi:lysophospholipase L1-like esterase
MAGHLVIVALGDSTTAGTPGFKSPVEVPPAGEGDPQSQFAFWLERRHRDWTVLNRGVNGERTDQIAARMDRDVFLHHPSALVLIAGVNDVYQGRAVEEIKAELAEIYRRARRVGLPVVAGSIVPYNTATPEQNAKMHDINAWIAAQAGQPDLIYADTRAAVAADGQPDRLRSSPDDLHPDADGYRRMAEALAPAIERALEFTVARRPRP